MVQSWLDPCLAQASLVVLPSLCLHSCRLRCYVAQCLLWMFPFEAYQDLQVQELEEIPTSRRVGIGYCVNSLEKLESTKQTLI